MKYWQKRTGYLTHCQPSGGAGGAIFSGENGRSANRLNWLRSFVRGALMRRALLLAALALGLHQAHVDPAYAIPGVWSATGSLNTARDSHTATLLSNGQVLVAGGWDTDTNS